MFKNIGWFHIFFISKMAQCLKTLVGFTFFHIEDGAMFKNIGWFHIFFISKMAQCLKTLVGLCWFHIFFISKMAQCLKTLVGFTFFSYRRWGSFLKCRARAQALDWQGLETVDEHGTHGIPGHFNGKYGR